MTPEQIIEDYRAAFVAALGEEAGRAVTIEDWSGAFLVGHAYHDLDGTVKALDPVIYAASDIVAATRALRERANSDRPASTEQRPPTAPPILQRTDDSVLGPVPVDNGALGGEPEPHAFGDLERLVGKMRAGEPLTFDQLAEALRVTYDGLSITVQPDGHLLHLGKENQDALADIQQELARHGYTLDEASIEHDCISGRIVPKGKE